MLIKELRTKYHKELFDSIMSVDKNGVPGNADKHSVISVKLAKGIIDQIGFKVRKEKSAGQTAGKAFETITSDFINRAFTLLQHLRPGEFEFFLGKSIEKFEQYEHLAALDILLKANKELRSTLGDYIVNPDIVIGRAPVTDIEINKRKQIIDKTSYAKQTPFRKENSKSTILHASISCKWTIRSDRSQNSRTEGLNLIRNRKGHTPHIAIVTAEPYPQRIASLAMGTGDIDCVYHFALYELLAAAFELKNEVVIDILDTLVSGKRLRDISDLPFDLVT